MSTLLTAALVTAGAAAGAVPLIGHRRRRQRLYRELSRRRDAIVGGLEPRIGCARDPAALRPRFAQERLVQVDGFLDTESLGRLQNECLAHRAHAERSFIPGHKKGGTLSYEAIHRRAPACLAFYHSTALRAWLNDLTGLALLPTADHDQSSCSLLYYDQPGDHIGWHYDYNFYRGRHFTVLLSLFNQAARGGPSAGELERRRAGAVSGVATPANTLVVFEGARVFHRATQVRDGDERIMLSMTFCTDPRIGRWRELVRRIKDTAYYGPRALID